jgi:hypothetical protein
MLVHDGRRGKENDGVRQSNKGLLTLQGLYSSSLTFCNDFTRHTKPVACVKREEMSEDDVAFRVDYQSFSNGSRKLRRAIVICLPVWIVAPSGISGQER